MKYLATNAQDPVVECVGFIPNKEEDYPCVDIVGAPLKLQESFGLLENIDSKANLSVPNDCPKEKRSVCKE